MNAGQPNLIQVPVQLDEINADEEVGVDDQLG